MGLFFFSSIYTYSFLAVYSNSKCWNELSTEHCITINCNNHTFGNELDGLHLEHKCSQPLINLMELFKLEVPF